MGFTTGFISGITLTALTIHLSLTLHARNRQHQSALLRQQSTLLTNITAPQTLQPLAVNREVRAGVVETAKDRWNAELERNVRVVQGLDWGKVREEAEEGVGAVWRKVFSGGK